MKNLYFIDILIEKGANTEQKTAGGKNLLHLAPSSSISIEFIEDLFEDITFSSLEYLLNGMAIDNE